MKEYIEKRAVLFASYIIENNTTVRDTAKKFDISKSTVHKDVTQTLKHVSPSLYEKVQLVLEKNKDERHLRGGEATKNKYLSHRRKEN